MKKNQGLDIEYLSFDLSTLLADKSFLHNLATFYCSIWMYDPNFGEYMMCPECGKYFSEEVVKQDGVNTCSGRKKKHETVSIVPAWDPQGVANDELIGNATKYSDNFYGIYAVDKRTGKIVGFTWGWLESAEDIREKWEDVIADKLGSKDSTYYSEIAVDPSPDYRGQGIGKELCSRLVMWMKSAQPDIPSFLRTHKTSYAKKMFESVGYQYFADDPKHGDGRIMLMVKTGQDLVP